MDQLFDFIAARIGIDPEMLVLYLGVLVAIANIVGKQIPSSATGWLGAVRKIALVIGLYVPQKVTSNVSTKNVAEAMAATLPDAVIKTASDKLPTAVRIGTEAGDVAGTLLDIAHGRSPGRAYVPGESPEPDSIVPDQYRTDGPFAAQKKKGK